MTFDARRLVIVTAFLAGFCSLPAVSSAQCYFDYGIYAGLDYEQVTEDTINLYSWGAGIDYSTCGEACGHGYAMDLKITRLPETDLYTRYEPDQTEFNVPIFGASLTTTPESFKVEFKETVFCWCALAVVGEPVAQSTIQVQPCINAPIIRIGWVPSASFNYLKTNFTIAGADAAADNAFTNWTSANQTSGLSTSFSPWTTGGVDIYVQQNPAIMPPEAGGVSYYRTDASGFVTGGTVAISDPSTNPAVTNATTVLKVLLHEIGHLSGLGDTGGSNGSSVMNQLSGNDDAGGNLPTAVTTCDRNRAWLASNN